MTRRPTVGITVHVVSGPIDPGSGPVYALAERYARAVVAGGGVPVLLPTTAEGAAPHADVVATLDGLLLSGGRGDRTRAFVGDAAPSLRATDPVRYDHEVGLLHAAWAEGVPVLGICRGFQTLVEAAGGRLHERLDRLQAGGVRHDQNELPGVATHGLRLAPEGALRAALGVDHARVNSFHRQGVAEAPADFRVAAWSDDGLIEAVEGHGGRTVGLQFHPEWLYGAEPRWLAPFSGLVAAARERVALRGR